jgi:hypothetical protein
MTRTISCLTLLLALLAFAAPAGAQPSLQTPARSRAAEPGAQDPFDKRIWLDFKGAAPRDVFKTLADAIGCTAEVAPDVSSPVDILIRNVSVRTALNTTCESIGCTWRVSGTVIRVEKGRSETTAITRPVPGTRGDKAAARVADVAEMRRLMDQVLPVVMRFERAPLADVAARLSKATGLEITLRGPRPDQTLTADFGGKPFSAALKALSEQLDGKVGMIAGRKGTGTPSMRIVIGARKPRK